MALRNLAWLGIVLGLIGCDAPDARFRLNMVYVGKQERESGSEFTRDQLEDLANVLTAMVGTPDEPFLPRGGSSGIDQLFDDVSLVKLKLAAGPVKSDQLGSSQGLYRRHCTHCHGISGDGAGPTAAFLNPHPRDFRKGVFKFKSTPRGEKPTREDLKRTLIHGIQGTAMPSFRLLADDELDALVEYVNYLSIRGEVERILVREMALEFDGEEDRLDKSSDFLIDDVLARVVGAWSRAESRVTPIPPPPTWNEEEKQTSIRRGRDLFYGAVANCVKCHGDTQLGDGQTDDYDDWAKDFYDWTTVTDVATKKKLMVELVSLGGLKPRNIIPRNLRQNVYRGGRRPLDVYLRIHDGIDGTPMPASLIKPAGAPADAKGLTTDDVWDLVNFVQSLPYDALSGPGPGARTFMRERM